MKSKTTREIIDMDPAARTWRERLRYWNIKHLFWECGRGSGDCVFFVPVYGGDGEWWRPWIIKPLHRIGCRYTDVRRWVQARTYRRAHVIKTSLEPSTYYDPDTQILWACMACVDRYIGEGEWIITVEQEIIDIAHWWHIEKPAEEKLRDELLHELYGRENYKITYKPVPDNKHLNEMVFPDMSAAWEARNVEFRALEKKISQDEDDQLVKLMKIRQHMWI